MEGYGDKTEFLQQHQMLVSGHCNTPATLFPGNNPQYPHWTQNLEVITVSSKKETTAIQPGTSPHSPDLPNLEL